MSRTRSSDSTVVLVGTSHERAPVALRERIHLDPPAAARLARELAGDDGEAVCLSTCNRIEIYLAHADPELAAERARGALARLAGDAADELAEALEVRHGEDAVAHLLRVAGGLCSIVTGEAQILSQVRKAHARAAALGATGPVLERLFAHAVRAGKRIRSQTRLGSGPVSAAEAAVQLAGRRIGDLRDRRAVVIGAGAMAELAAVHLRARGARDIVIANRTLSRASALARRVGGRAIGLERLAGELRAANVVISCTGASGLVVGREHVSRGGGPLLLVDLAMPRDVDPSLGALPGVHVYDLDDLGSLMAEGSAAERAQAARAEEILGDEAQRFRSWRRSRAAAAAITALRGQAEEIRRSVLAHRAPDLDALAPRERLIVESLTSQLVARLLHAPTLELRRAAADGAS
jgi:glutamyl-tRNA reductase